MSNKFRHGFLQGESQKSESVRELVQGKFDYTLLSSSWDKRCLSITKANDLQSLNCAIIFPDLRDELGLRDKHDPQLVEFANNIGNCYKIHGDSSNIDDLWNQLSNHMWNVHQELGRPLRIFIDLSTCVRYLSLGFLSQGLLTGIVSEATVFYAEGIYPEEESEEDKYELFTYGGWEALPIPGMEGEWDPDKKRSYLVSVGFEGSKTLRLVSREEPDEVSLLFPDPGFKQEYVNRTEDRNKQLIQRFQIPDEHIIRSHAGDAIEGWKKLTEASIEQPDDQNIYYVCSGTKPQSLALALRALVLRYPALLYIIPDRHRVIDIDAFGVYWRFDLKDMSSVMTSSEHDPDDK